MATATDRQRLIDNAPVALKRLGERLACLLDADHWNNIEPLLLEVAALSQPSGSRVLPDELRRYIPDIVRNAMLTMWNEICADTNCHPLDIEQNFEGQQGHLGFTPQHWARMTGNMVLANLDSYFAAQPSGRDAGLEEAAKVCESMIENPEVPAAIRALKGTSDAG